MPFTADDVLAHTSAQADAPAAPDRISGVDIIARLEANPRLTLDDILAEADAPSTVPTLTGRDNQAPSPIPFLVPPLPRPSDAVPEGQGLQPQTPQETARLQADAESASNLAFQGAVTGAGGPFAHAAGRVAGGVVSTIARHPIAASVGLGGAGLVAAPASTQEATPPSPVTQAQDALNRLLAQQSQLSERQTALRQDLTRFDALRDDDIAGVRTAQQFLSARGFNPGGTDGRMGATTRAALRDYRQAVERELTQLSTDLNGLSPNITAAQQTLASANRVAGQEAGAQRLRDMDANTPWYQRAWHTFGPYAGLLLGGVAGYGSRAGIGAVRGEIAQRRADRADELMEQAGRGSISGRAARVNQFWDEGGGRPVPFERAPTRRPEPWRPNAEAPSADSLYRPGVVSRFAPGVALGGVGGVEALAAHQWLVVPAREELTAAQTAAAADPSEVNVRRLQDAKDRLANAEAIAYFGRGMALGVAGGEVKSQLKYAPPRPNVAAAEAERGLLDRALADGPAARGRRSAAPSHHATTQARGPDGRFKGE